MSQVIGQKLQETRQELNISLEQAAEETRIRPHYLRALESGDISQLPSKAHEKGFLRAYAEYLGLDPDSLLNNLDSDEEFLQDPVYTAPAGPSEEEPGPPSDSQRIFQELGEVLRKQRELLGFSLVEIERNIHVREHYLATLERGDIDGLPSPVQGRGMLQNYASFLSLDVDAVMLKYADGLQAQLAEKRVVQPEKSDTQPRRRRMRLPFTGIFPGDWLLRTVLIVAVLAFVIWGVTRISSLQAAVNPLETIPPIVEALQTTPDIEVVETPQGTENPAEEPTELASVPGQGNEIIPQPTEIANPETPIPTVDDAPVQLYVTVLRRAWMRVSVDGDIEFEGRVIPGSAYSFSGEFQIELLTGNGAALQVFFNGEDLGVLGVYGEVIYEVYTPQGVVLPTPTNTPVPTNTPPASPTPPATVVP